MFFGAKINENRRIPSSGPHNIAGERPTGGRRCGIRDCFPGPDGDGRCERLSGRTGPETGCPEPKDACSLIRCRRSAVRSGGKDASNPACPAGAFFFRFGRPQSPRRSAMRLGGSRAGESGAVTRWGRRTGPLRMPRSGPGVRRFPRAVAASDGRLFGSSRCGHFLRAEGRRQKGMPRHREPAGTSKPCFRFVCPVVGRFSGPD